MDVSKNSFENDLQENLKDPAFAEAYHREQAKIQMIDQLVNALDEARLSAGVTKSDIARSLQVEPANIRRFFTRRRSNPTLSTVIDIALSMGYELKLQKISSARTRS